MVEDVVVVGAGAAGLLAATSAGECGRRTLVLEKNPRAGVKILMSGGTRCNLTHATDAAGIIAAFGRQGRFLHSALAALGPDEVVRMVQGEGVATKVEATGKVFPASDRAADVVHALLRRLGRAGVELSFGEPLLQLTAGPNGFCLTTARRQVQARAVILTTGGMSYPGCGTTGDGYAWATELGHRLVPPRPALTPILTAAEWIKPLSGVTIPDVAIEVGELAAPADEAAGRPQRRGSSAARGLLAAARGSLLFTHFGLSGPVVLDVSRAVSSASRPETLELRCDFAPAESADELARWLDERCRCEGGRQIDGLLAERWPRRLIQALADVTAVSVAQRAAETPKRERQRLIETLQGTRVPVRGVMGFRKAEVTAGGVSLDDVDSRTMQSKRVPGLYFAGELLDLDGPIGGYNFQAAFSTGWLAGRSAAANR
jgi:predicted Rossmann fold flavoprotein